MKLFPRHVRRIFNRYRGVDGLRSQGVLRILLKYSLSDLTVVESSGNLRNYVVPFYAQVSFFLRSILDGGGGGLVDSCVACLLACPGSRYAPIIVSLKLITSYFPSIQLDCGTHFLHFCNHTTTTTWEGH